MMPGRVKSSLALFFVEICGTFSINHRTVDRQSSEKDSDERSWRSWRKFCAYCNKVLHGEALNYLDELKQQKKREVYFSELLQKDLEALYCCDDYDMAENFTVKNTYFQYLRVSASWLFF